MYVEGVVSGEVKVSRLAFSTLLVWRHCDTTTFSVHIDHSYSCLMVGITMSSYQS